MLVTRRKLLLAAPALIIPKRAFAFGGGSAPDPYILPRLPIYPEGWNFPVPARTQVAPSSLTGSVGCIVIAGDSVCSNVVNSTQAAAQSTNFNFNVASGGLYKTIEPLFGCNWNTGFAGFSGNFFTNVADTLIANSIYANVVLVPCGLGGSLLADYASGGALNGMFAPVKKRLDAAGLTATGLYFMCGANDTNSGTSQASATTSITSLVSTLRAIWPTTNIFVPTHTNFNLVTNAGIQAALQSVWSSGNKVFDGGNMDSITSSSNYWDNTHPNSTGRVAMASLAATAITSHP